MNYLQYLQGGGSVTIKKCRINSTGYSGTVLVPKPRL